MKDRLLGRVVADRYRLEARLGVGGMGAVYRARHLLIDRIVAIKILQPERRGEEHFRAWFLREARAVNRINHANIVDINDFGETEDGLAYLVMELLVGEGLSAHIARGPMDLRFSVDVLEQVTAALARAHDLGVVHRDVKPDNIYLINKGGRRNFVKLLDFGLARLSRDGRLAAKGAVFGTPEYMSPEQARGEDATPVSDLYSLGVIFFEMVTGRLPFSAHDRDGYIQSHKKVMPPSPDRFNNKLDPKAVQIINTLLEKDIGRRFRDAHHLLEEFKALQRKLGPAVPIDPNHSADRPSTVTATSSFGIQDEVASWALRATIFGRMVARTYPDSGGPKDVREALECLWRLVAAVARVDGERQAEANRNDELQRRGREFRAQLGRRIEDLSREQSRLKREIAAAMIDLVRLKEEYERAGTELAEARGIISSAEQEHDEMSDSLREAYERAGAAAARRQGRAEAVAKVETKIRKWEDECDRIAAQIDEYRTQLDHQSSTYEEEIDTLRSRLSNKVQERDDFYLTLNEAVSLLREHFDGRPECRSLFDELHDLERVHNSVVASNRDSV